MKSNLEKKPVRVVFISDENYSIPTAVVCNSIIKNKKISTIIEIAIITTGLKRSVREFLSCTRTDHVNIKIIDIENDIQHLAHDHPYVSSAALLKFLIPKIFPDFDRILYLDSDTIVLEDLSEFFFTPLHDAYAAVVKDMAAIEEGHHYKIHHSSYFNSGVMLLNLNKMRRENTSEKLIKLKSNKIFSHFMDQDEFNFVFNENVLYVSPTFNFMRKNYRQDVIETAKFYELSIDEFLLINKYPTILHLTNNPKTWFNPNEEDFDIWIRYLPEILFADFVRDFSNHYASIIETRVESRAQQAESRAQQAESMAQQAEAAAKEILLQLNAVYASTSWRVTAPLRAISRGVHSLTLAPRTIKSGIKQGLRSCATQVARRPRLKRLALVILNRMPTLKARLKQVTGDYRNTFSSSTHQPAMPLELHQLSPRARQIYADLKSALAKRQGEK